MYFATIEDLKIALWRALIYPAEHKRQLNDLENGFCARIAVTEEQWKAFYKCCR
jgi:L-rhamnose isomerase